MPFAIRMLLVVEAMVIILLNIYLLTVPSTTAVPSFVPYALILAVPFLWFGCAATGCVVYMVPLGLHFFWVTRGVLRLDIWMRLRLRTFFIAMVVAFAAYAVSPNTITMPHEDQPWALLGLVATFFLAIYSLLRATHPLWVLKFIRVAETTEVFD